MVVTGVCELCKLCEHMEISAIPCNSISATRSDTRESWPPCISDRPVGSCNKSVKHLLSLGRPWPQLHCLIPFGRHAVLGKMNPVIGHVVRNAGSS